MTSLSQLARAWEFERAHGGRPYPAGRAGKVYARILTYVPAARIQDGAVVPGRVYINAGCPVAKAHTTLEQFLAQSRQASENVYALYRLAVAQGYLVGAHDELVSPGAESL